MDEQTRQTVLNSAQLGSAPASAYPELQKYYDVNFQLPLSNAGVRALSGQAEAQGAQREFDTKQQIQREEDKQSGKGYKQQPKEDGGFAFFGPDGQEVSAQQFARATGKSVYDVLSNSENPIDIGFREDYANLEEFMQAAVSGDREALDTYYKQQPSLKNLSPQEVLSKFRQAYPTVYGGQKPGVPVNNTFVPNLRTVRNNQDYLAGGGGVGS